MKDTKRRLESGDMMRNNKLWRWLSHNNSVGLLRRVGSGDDVVAYPSYLTEGFLVPWYILF